MADAIHEITSGQTVTLQGIAALYFAVTRPGGALELGRAARVIKAIRVRTGASLTGVTDAANIPVGTVLKIPTFREIPGAILCDDPVLKAALMAAGYDHATKLLRRSLTSVVDLLGPFTGTPYDAGDVTRAYRLTQLFDLDGMDLRTSIHLHDTSGIDTLAELASQSEATLQGILNALVTGGRPAPLATQGHAARWRISARIHGRNLFSKRLKRQRFQIPFPSAQATARAEHYDAISHDTGQTSADRMLARRLALLHRFQASVVDGNFHAVSKRWDRAAASHTTARKLFHRLAEDLGAASNVDDDVGVDLATAIETAYQMLKVIPPDNETPLGAPRLRTTFDDSSRPYRLETDATAQDGKSVLLPAPDPTDPSVKVRLNAASFATDYRANFLNGHVGGNAAGTARIAASAWVDSGSFAALAPFLYGGAVRATLGQSLSMQGLGQLANQNSNPYFDLVTSDGTIVANWSNMDGYIRDFDLSTCSTDYLPPAVVPAGQAGDVLTSWLRTYCDARTAEADILYRQNRRTEASAIYADVICAIENFWASTDQSFLATDAQTAFGAVANGALTLARGATLEGPFRSIEQLSLLCTSYEDGTPVTDGLVNCVMTSAAPGSFEQNVEGMRDWFSFESPGPPTMQSIIQVSMNASIVGTGVFASNGLFQAFVDAELIDACYFEYLYAQAKFQAIGAGLNWFGFADSFIPTWSFEYLWNLAADLAGKAVDTERQVFQMEQLYEQAAEKEFLADQAVTLSEAQLAVADARVAQAAASAVVASQQAALTANQAAAAANQSAMLG